jgi:hypothetical protein
MRPDPSSEEDGPFALGEAPLRIVPVCHDRMEFAVAVRQAIRYFRPQAVAVELPPALGEAFLRAVDRLPYLSVLAYADEEGQAMYLPVEPADPLVEAVRTARELDLPVHFVDLHVTDYPEHRDLLPDSYLLNAGGLKAFWEAFQALPRTPPNPLDERREAHMAARAETLSREADLLLVCGIAHAHGILQALAEGTGTVHRHRPMGTVQLADPDLDSVRESCAEMPWINAVYEFSRGGPGPDRAWAPPPLVEEPPAPPPTRLEGLSGQDAIRSLEALLGMNPGVLKEEELPPDLRRAVARALQALKDPGWRLPGQEFEPPPQLADAPHAPRARIFKFRSVPDRRPEMREFLGELTARPFLDRQRVLAALFERAAAHHAQNTGEPFKTWQRRTLVQFTGNYSRLRGELLPGLYACVVSARGVADDNYAYEVWDLGSFYPWTEAGDGTPPIRVRAGEVWLDGVKTMRFRRRLPRLRESLVRVPVKPRPQEENPGDWAREFQGGTICSYPPEDVIIEDFGRYLQKRAGVSNL